MFTHLPADAGPYRLISIETSDLFIDSATGPRLVARLLKRALKQFCTLEAVGAFLVWENRRYSRNHHLAIARLDVHLDRPGLVLLDRFGDPVAVPQLLGAIERQRALLEAGKPSYAYRDGPAPGVHTGYRYGRYLRNPKTTAERRDNQEDIILDIDLEVRVPVRGRRRNLPNAWNDILVSGLRDRNWKRFRRTRWKPSSTSKEEANGMA